MQFSASPNKRRLRTATMDTALRRMRPTSKQEPGHLKQKGAPRHSKHGYVALVACGLEIAVQPGQHTASEIDLICIAPIARHMILPCVFGVLHGLVQTAKSTK